MKNVITLISCIAVIFIAGCAKKQGIVGHWKLVSAQQKQIDSLFDALRLNIKNMEDTLPKITNESDKKMFSQQLEENKQLLKNAEEQLKNIYKSSYLKYRADGTYEGMLMGQAESGTYTYDEANKVIKGKMAGAETAGELKVERLNADSLIVNIEEGNIRLIFVADKD
jgi:hypothetical protein